jgi:hypothetical protein
MANGILSWHAELLYVRPVTPRLEDIYLDEEKISLFSNGIAIWKIKI